MAEGIPFDALRLLAFHVGHPRVKLTEQQMKVVALTAELLEERWVQELRKVCNGREKEEG